VLSLPQAMNCRGSRSPAWQVARAANIDLIVMGGYGHSRLQERILGGVTRGMLQSMTVLTLMSH
jgi:nucleotide-binding universal stress UspA family protein